ncbi:MAG: YdcF family protein [Phycisphaeraceae bacterium]|nr:YdcF family protein [Phycisphaeraceae bacterium]
MGSLFFWTSKLVWCLISPDVLLGLGLVWVWLLLWRNRTRAAVWVLGCELLVITLIGLWPVGEWAFYPLEQRFETNPELPDQVHGVIVLGGAEDAVMSAIWKQPEVGAAAERMLAFMAMARRFPEAKLVYTGGSSSMVDQELRGADCVKQLFEQQGLDVSRVVLERESRNTFENVVLTKKLMDPREGENWLVITTAWHMPRAVGIFRQAGWSVIPWPVDHWSQPGRLLRVQWDPVGHLSDLKIAMKEWVGLLAYYATGKTNAVFPGS